MWKRLDEAISLSEKWARLSWPAMGIGFYVLSNSDSKGRFLADTRIIKGRCMTFRYDVRLELIEDALKELERERVLHLYDVDGKQYLVFHDHDDWNPPGALKNNAPKYPDPDPKICKCLRRESGANAPPVLSPSSSSSTSEGVEGEGLPLPDSPEARIMKLLEQRNCPSSPTTIRRYARGWITDKGFQFTECVAMDDWCKGKDVIAIHDRFFREPKGQTKSPKRKVVDKNCSKCAGRGRRPNPATGGEMDCGCVREVAV